MTHRLSISIFYALFIFYSLNFVESVFAQTVTPTPWCSACETALFQYGTGVAGSGTNQMNWCRGLALNNAGTTLYVADQGNFRVAAFPVGSGTAQDFTCVDAVKNPSGLSYPFGVGVDAGGNIYVADFTGNKVVEINPAGTVLAVYTSGLNQPTDVAVDNAGNMYILDLTQITKLGVGFMGTATQFGSGTINMATGITAQGVTIFVANKQNNRVDQWVPSPSYTMTTVYQPSAGLYPRKVAFDPTGRFAFVAENTNQLEVFDTSSGSWVNVATCTGGNLKEPAGVAIDTNGNFYISETQNSKAEKFGPLYCLSTPGLTPSPPG